MIDFKNIDNITISNDPDIGTAFYHTSINDPLFKTSHMLDVDKRIAALCEDYFYKVSIELATHQLHHTDDQKVEPHIRDGVLLVYSIICQYIIKSEILTLEEISDDVKDLKNTYDSTLFNTLNDYLLTFSHKFENLYSEFYHA